MARTKNARSRYLSILRQLKRGPKTVNMFLEEINKFAVNDDEKISHRTINQDINDLKDGVAFSGVFIPIINPRRGLYSLEEGFELDKIPEWPLLEKEEFNRFRNQVALASQSPLFSQLTNVLNRLADSILVESVGREMLLPKEGVIQTDDPEYVVGNKYLEPIANAVLNCRSIRFKYQKYGERNSTPRNIHPLLMKEYRGRWYIVGQPINEFSFKTFALDRIQGELSTGDVFDYPNDFQPEVYFNHTIGINRGDKEPIEIVLRFTKRQGEYIRSLKIHESQVELSNQERFYRVKLTVIPNYEFFEILLGFGEAVIVESPPFVVDEVVKRLRSSLDNYK